VSRDLDDREWDDRRRQPDDDYRPPRHRYADERDDYDDEQFRSRDVRQRVVAPGVALMIVGILGVLGSLGMAAFFAFMMIEESKRGAGGGPDAAITAVIFVLLSGFSLAACVVVTLGGARMRQCRNYGLAMTAAILAIASIALFGLCSVFIIPFGIWALVVLNNSEVKREFRRTKQPSDPDAEDYSD
jgi:magnesium-transporting ATPase (P-type)